MPRSRTIVDLDPDLHYALQLRAVETGRSVSDWINEAVRLALAGPAAQAFQDRQPEREPPPSSQSSGPPGNGQPPAKEDQDSVRKRIAAGLSRKYGLRV